MRKYGTPEPIRPVQEERAPEADPQGINVTATRREAEGEQLDIDSIIHEGEDGQA